MPVRAFSSTKLLCNRVASKRNQHKQALEYEVVCLIFSRNFCNSSTKNTKKRITIINIVFRAVRSREISFKCTKRTEKLAAIDTSSGGLFSIGRKTGVRPKPVVRLLYDIGGYSQNAVYLRRS